MKNKAISIFIISLTLIGFHLNYPLVYFFWGRTNAPFGIELFTSIPVAIIGIVSLKYFVIEQKIIAFLFFLFIIWILFGGLLVHGTSLNQMKNPIALFLIMAGAYYLFFKYWAEIALWIPKIFYFVIISYSLFMLSRILMGDYEFFFTGTRGVYLQRISIGETLPTELSVFLGIQFCYLFYVWKTQFLKNFTLLLLFSIAVFIIYTGSKAGIIGLIIITILYLKNFRNIKFSQKLFLAISTIVILFLLWDFGKAYLIPTIKLTQYTQEGILNRTDSRLEIYGYLWDLMKEKPSWGVGMGEFNRRYYKRVPHQNFLGIGCELGIPSLIFYILFICLTIYHLFILNRIIMLDKGKSTVLKKACFFIEMCFIVLLFLQFRGLFMDTWTLKEQYFLIGAGLGVGKWSRKRIKEQKISYQIYKLSHQAC